MRKLLFAFVALFVVSFTVKGGSPKYIFLFIGDGMAAPQRMIAEEFSTRFDAYGKWRVQQGASGRK